jgi:hypothetical protein
LFDLDRFKFMKFLPFLFAFAAFSLPLKASETWSPDGQWEVAKAGLSLQVMTRDGVSVLTLSDSTSGYDHLEVSWSEDSTRAVVAANARRGSLILAAWHEGAVWHKTLQVMNFPELGPFGQANGGILEEHRSLGSWQPDQTLIVYGGVHFRNNASLRYFYALKFAEPGAPLVLDKGGYEEGAIVGTRYAVEGEP